MPFNQSQISDGIAHLPIFLAGCDSLLVLYGETYLSRLWCVVELYVFTHMRGINVEVVALPRSADVGSAQTQQLDRFDVQACRSVLARAPRPTGRAARGRGGCPRGRHARRVPAFLAPARPRGAC
jgi:hypothetical protein